MVKYVDSGMDDSGGKGGKKKVKKGFKADRRENYLRMIDRKNGKAVKKQAESKTARVKSVTFDKNSLRDYVLTLHRRKNERRVQAFVDVKRKMKKDHARTRREQREQARHAYNKFAKIPILPNYTYKLPTYDEENDDEEEEAVSAASEQSASDGEGDVMPWVYRGTEHDSPEAAEEEQRRMEKEEARERRARIARRRAKRLATEALTTHTMPASMTGEEETEQEGSTDSRIDDEYVTVEVKPLFGGSSQGAAGSVGCAGGGKKGSASAASSAVFAGLPAVVEQELRRLRQETKGPAKTKAKVHMMKELEKIRKIKKYSRKGHGKKSTSGKRKNRKK